jgi:hypothetical protein
MAHYLHKIVPVSSVSGTSQKVVATAVVAVVVFAETVTLSRPVVPATKD